jgi:hypothetical protein
MTSARSLYLVLAVIGAIVPYVPFIAWLHDQPMDGGIASRFFTELVSTRIGTFFGLDVVLSALTLFVFMFMERRARPMARMWPAVLGTLLAGVSCGLPLYLYERERAHHARGGGWGRN